jgi:hypothetical protein
VLNLRAYRPANPPWTAYDTNSLFLAEVKANGTVVNPSFYPRWLNDALTKAPQAAQKYMSLFPDPKWHPTFAPDFDGVGNVKNLELGPGGNDSKWMDLGFPVMTAANGKRYKVLFAPLIVDLSNRIHLWAHGNRQGTGAFAGMSVSNMGFGAPEVNLARAFGVPIKVPANGGAIEAGGVVTITTRRAHRFKAGEMVLISGVGSPGYDGVFTIAAVPNATSFKYTVSPPGLAPSGHGTAVHYDEWMRLFDLKYGGYTGNPLNLPKGSPVGLGPQGPWYAPVDFDGYDKASGKGSGHLVQGFQTNSTNNVNAGPAQSMSVKPTGATPFPWAFFDVVTAGTFLVVGSNAANTETVKVLNVSPATSSFTADFAKGHGALLTKVSMDASATLASPYFAFPSYPKGWDNLGGAPLTEQDQGKPLGFNLVAPTLPNLGVVVAQKSLLMSNQEALMRFGGTNSPALTSEIFRRMPLTFNAMRPRNMVTMWSTHFDRIVDSPYIPFDPFDLTQPAHYIYPDGTAYPVAKKFTPPDPATTAKLPDKSEYSSDWRSRLGEKLRVNLNRPLKSFPTVKNANGYIINMADYNQALADRRNFARDIYNALVRVTGAQDPNVVMMVKTSDEYKASRWLAQLAVNIVDYIDEDDYMTFFNWDKSRSTSTDAWVAGTELPRLVLNEAYAQHDITKTGSGNDADDWTVNVNVWAELLNPLKASPDNVYPLDTGAAWLNLYDNHNPYNVEIHASNAALKAALSDPANTMGSSPNTLLRLLDDNYGPKHSVIPSYDTNGAANVPPMLDTKFIADPTGSDNSTGVHQNGSTVTVITKVAHNFAAGRAVTISNVPVLGYNGTFNITSVPTPTSFKYTAAVSGLARSGGGTATFVKNNSNGFYVLGPAGAAYATLARVPNLPATWVAPKMAFSPPKYSIAGAPTGATFAGGTATITTTDKHPFKAGDTVIIAGVANNGYNGTFTITNVPNNKMLKYIPGAGNLVNSGGGIATIPPPNSVALLLRRKAFYHLDHNDDAGSPTYNPYVTVDYLDGIRLTPYTGPATAGKSFGRRQPYTAHPSQVAAQVGTNPTQPANTFFQHNSNALLPFKWLTHLDRPLVNQLELLQVSGYRPHELTQRFVVGANSYQHRAPWDKQDALIFRVLDLLGTPNHMAGTFSGGRWPGQINLNTITEPEIFQALCDSQDSQTNALFKTDSVGKSPATRPGTIEIYHRLLAARNPTPGAEPAPFQPFAAGDVNKTWFRPDPDPTTLRPLFDVGDPAAHPYGQKALLQKIFNNITTTSNVFGVWWTAGYFEVVDESARPPRLGKEIGRDENRQIRHRFFAVVDRSGMQLFDTRSEQSSLTPGPSVPLWDNTTFYLKDTNVVMNIGGGQFASYRCIKSNAGVAPDVPPLNTTYWVPDCVTVGAAWDSTVNYNIGCNVVYAGLPYRSRKANNKGNVPTGTSWDPVTLRMNFTKIPQTYTANGVPIGVQPGMMLEIGGNEVVSVRSPAGINFLTADFTKSHNVGATIVCRGNPGPPALRGAKTTYNPRHDSSVVLHMTVIQ